MQQHISVEQLKELNFDFVYNKLYPLVENFEHNDEEEFYSLLAKKLTIGKMIEILSKESSVFKIDRYDDCNGETWDVRGTFYGNERRYYEALDKELVNSLWKCTKELIER